MTIYIWEYTGGACYAPLSPSVPRAIQVPVGWFMGSDPLSGAILRGPGGQALMAPRALEMARTSSQGFAEVPVS